MPVRWQVAGNWSIAANSIWSRGGSAQRNGPGPNNNRTPQLNAPSGAEALGEGVGVQKSVRAPVPAPKCSAPLGPWHPAPESAKWCICGASPGLMAKYIL